MKIHLPKMYCYLSIEHFGIFKKIKILIRDLSKCIDLFVKEENSKYSSIYIKTDTKVRDKITYLLTLYILRSINQS